MSVRPEQIGTVEILRLRAYNTECGEFAVEPGIYPVLRHGDRYSLVLDGRSSNRRTGEVKSLGDGMFMVQPAYDEMSGPVTSFPHGYWSPDEFAALLAHPVAQEGGPEQRLRFRLDEPAGGAR